MPFPKTADEIRMWLRSGAWWCEYCFAVLLCGGLEME